MSELRAGGRRLTPSGSRTRQIVDTLTPHSAGSAVAVAPARYAVATSCSRPTSVWMTATMPKDSPERREDLYLALMSSKVPVDSSPMEMMRS
jgi:hypothetical protein